MSSTTAVMSQCSNIMTSRSKHYEFLKTWVGHIKWCQNQRNILIEHCSFTSLDKNKIFCYALWSTRSPWGAPAAHPLGRSCGMYHITTQFYCFMQNYVRNVHQSFSIVWYIIQLNASIILVSTTNAIPQHKICITKKAISLMQIHLAIGVLSE